MFKAEHTEAVPAATSAAGGETPAGPTPAQLAISGTAADLLFREARTANTFTDEPVTDEQVAAIYELAKFGPTALNAQPLRVTLLRSPESRARLLPLLNPGNRAKTASAPLVAILSYDVDFHDNLPQVFPHAPGVRDGFVGDLTKRTAFAQTNAALQAGYFIMAVRAVGLAAGPMGGYDAAAVNAEFFDGTQRVLMVVNLGKPGPDAWRQRLPRLGYDQAVRSI